MLILIILETSGDWERNPRNISLTFLVVNSYILFFNYNNENESMLFSSIIF